MPDPDPNNFTETMPDPLNTIDELPALLSFWNDEICKKQQSGKAYIYSVYFDNNEKNNLVWFKPAAATPVPPAKVIALPMTSDGLRPAILEQELPVRSMDIAMVGGQQMWVVLFDAAPPSNGNDDTDDADDTNKPPTHTDPGPLPPFKAARAKVFNRGIPSVSFLQELAAWGKSAPDEIFAVQPGNAGDIYSSIVDELGPFSDLTYRKACMLEVMRVLAGFEASWNWNEGIDTTRLSATTPSNAEAGMWQVSSDSLAFGQDLKTLVNQKVGSLNGLAFQKAMKANHPLAMEYIARLMRHTRKHNGPLYKKGERSVFRAKLQGPEQSVYPWLSRDAVAEFQKYLA